MTAYKNINFDSKLHSVRLLFTVCIFFWLAFSPCTINLAGIYLIYEFILTKKGMTKFEH